MHLEAWFHDIDFQTLHLQPPPFKPDLCDPTDTRYFDEDIDDAPLRKFTVSPSISLFLALLNPVFRIHLAAADAVPGQAEVTKDPLLRNKAHGKQLLDVRKQLAFQGYTFVKASFVPSAEVALADYGPSLQKSPKQRVFDLKIGIRSIAADLNDAEDTRGRSFVREPSSGFRRAMSL